MKKLLAGILATTMGLACLTSCALGDSSTPPAYDVEKGADTVFSMYVDKIGSGREDYTLVNTVVGADGLAYTVTWSVEAADGVVTLTRNETNTTVDVNETLDEDANYTLTATISAPDGTTKTEKFYGIVEAAPSIVPIAITEAPVEGTAYKLYMRQVTNKTDLYFTGKMSGFYLASTNASNGETYENGVDVYVENVDGKAGYFYLTFTDADNEKQYIGLSNTHNDKGWHINATYNSTRDFSHITDECKTGTYEFTYSEQYGTIVGSLQSASFEDEDDTTILTQDVTCYIGTYGTYYTFGASNVEQMDDKSCVGKLVTMVDKSTVSAQDKVDFEAGSLSVTTIYNDNATEELPTIGTKYFDVAVSWAVKEGENVSITNNVLTVTAPTETSTAVITATLTCGTATKTVDVELTLNVPVNMTAIVDAAYALSSGSALDGTHTLTGTIISVDTAYDGGYKNITVTIVVDGRENKPIQCYRMKGTGADVIKVGDKITVTGTLKNYYNTIEFDAGCSLDSYDANATVSNAVKVVTEKGTLDIETTSYNNTASLSLPTSGSKYSDVIISWAADNALATISGGTVTIAQVSATTTIKLTATITAGTASATKDFTITVNYVAANATTTSVTFSEIADIAVNAQVFDSYELDNVITVSASKATGQNAPAYYNTGTAIRIYGNNTLTIACKDGYKISSITLTTGSGSNIIADYTETNCTVVVDGTTTTVTPTDGTQDVVLQRASGSGQWRIVTILVVYEAI